MYLAVFVLLQFEYLSPIDRQNVLHDKDEFRVNLEMLSKHDASMTHLEQYYTHDDGNRQQEMNAKRNLIKLYEIRILRIDYFDVE